MLCFYLVSCVQIIVESFPVSSSGHCYLLLNFLKKSENIFFSCTDFISQRAIYSPTFLESFDHMLHAVTLFVLAVFFFERWKIYLLRMRSCLPIFFKAVLLTALADIITSLFYFFLKIYPIELPLIVGFSITAMSLGSLYMITVCPCLSFVTFSVGTENTQDERKGIFPSCLFKFYSKIKNRFSSISQSDFLPAHPECFCVSKNVTKDIKGWRSDRFTPTKALIIGLVQGIALLPGISRLATTYTAARWLGLHPRKAFEISWLIAVPLFLAASAQGVYKIMYMPEVHWLVVGALPYIIGAGIVAYGALKITAHLFYTHKAWWFGLYMIVPICWALKLYLL